jgi:CRP-like cAMP-binding protein
MGSDEAFGYRGGNTILDRLPPHERATLLPCLTTYVEEETAAVRLREQPIDSILFPIDAIYSVVAELSRDAYEVAVIGREGVVGAEVLLGAEVAPRSVLCQGSGHTVRMGVAPFRAAVEQSPMFLASVRESLRRQWFISQQTVACNFAHSLEQRAARWILMSHDAIGRDVFPLRAEFFSMMLGVPAAELRTPMTTLQHALDIAYDGENVWIHSRVNLLEAVCECYRLQQMSPFIAAPAINI